MSKDLTAEVVRTSLNHMFRQGWLSICTIDKVAALLNIHPGRTAAYRKLSALHCVHFNEMPPEVREAVPKWIMDCLNLEPMFQFELSPPAPAAKEEKSFVRRLLS